MQLSDSQLFNVSSGWLILFDHGTKGGREAKMIELTAYHTIIYKKKKLEKKRHFKLGHRVVENSVELFGRRHCISGLDFPDADVNDLYVKRRLSGIIPLSQHWLQRTFI